MRNRNVRRSTTELYAAYDRAGGVEPPTTGSQCEVTDLYTTRLQRMETSGTGVFISKEVTDAFTTSSFEKEGAVSSQVLRVALVVLRGLAL